MCCCWVCVVVVVVGDVGSVGVGGGVDVNGVGGVSNAVEPTKLLKPLVGPLPLPFADFGVLGLVLGGQFEAFMRFPCRCRRGPRAGAGTLVVSDSKGASDGQVTLAAGGRWRRRNGSRLGHGLGGLGGLGWSLRQCEEGVVGLGGGVGEVEVRVGGQRGEPWRGAEEKVGVTRSCRYLEKGTSSCW